MEAMARPTFTWRVVPPNHLIQSVCNSCTRMIGVSANRGLLQVLERVHDCDATAGKSPSAHSIPARIKPRVN